MVRVLLLPARGGGRAYMRLVSAGMGMFSGILNRILGSTLLSDVSMFVSALETMFGGFRERAEKTYRLLKRSGTAFLVVAAPESDALREAAYFVERLGEERMPLAGLVLNRMHGTAAPNLSRERSLAAAELLEDEDRYPLAASVLRLHADRLAVVHRDGRLRRRFTAAHPRVPVAEVPAFAEDVHDLDGLRAVATALAGGARSAAAG
jgi:anion-transporting  ArsA/GET3 family ATPase